MRKIPIWKNVVLVISLIVVTVVATFTWFYTGPTATAGGVGVQVGKATYIQISGDEGNEWSGDLDVEIGINKNFKEISGDGGSFYAPVYDFLEGADGFSAQLVSFNKLNEREFYYEQTMDFRSDTVQNVYLSPESCVTSVNAQNGYIDGAIRVAFFEIDENGNEELRFIWAPNSKVQYSASSNSFTKNGSVEPYYYYQKSANPVDVSALEESTDDVAVIPTQNTDEFGCGYDQANKFMWSNGENLPADAPFAVALDAEGDDKHFYGKLKIKVWLEGHDRECVSLLSGQRFTMNLRFSAKEEE